MLVYSLVGTQKTGIEKERTMAQHIYRSVSMTLKVKNGIRFHGKPSWAKPIENYFRWICLFVEGQRGHIYRKKMPWLAGSGIPDLQELDSVFDDFVKNGDFAKVRDTNLRKILEKIRTQRLNGTPALKRRYAFLPQKMNIGGQNVGIDFFLIDREHLSSEVRLKFHESMRDSLS
jgi:hypothetical protein